jgi:hypothetical protein
MKKIILTESEITKIVRKSIQNKLNEDKFSVEPEVSRQPRERDIDSLFGKYTYHVPDDVIRYMRKNPSLIVKRLLDIYGEDKLMNYVDMARNPKEMDMRLDSDSLRDELGEGAADTDGDGEISKDELHKHFDLDSDDTVTPKEYDDHIKDHIKKATNEQEKLVKRLISK